MKDVHYRFHPRYTPGSPGNWINSTYDSKLFDRLIAEEKESHARYLEGVYGEPAKEAAAVVGLAGIAEARIEAGRGKQRGWDVHDLITDERFHVISDDMHAHEQRQHAYARHVNSHGACRWCKGSIDLAIDAAGDLVCAGCQYARKTFPPIAWCEDLARAFRKQREHMA